MTSMTGTTRERHALLVVVLLLLLVYVCGALLGLPGRRNEPDPPDLPDLMTDSDAVPWWQHVDRFLYINLDHRTDRRQHIEDVLLRQLEIPPDRVERLPAVAAVPGWRGCAQSHLNAVRLARERQYAYVCIVEDDFSPLSSEVFHREVQRAWTTLDRDFDVLLLGMTPIRLQRQHTDPLFRVRASLALPGYVVPAAYLPVLEQTYARALAQGQPIDVLTHERQPRDRWYGFFPPLARQLPGFSDIEQRTTDYAYLEIDGVMLTFIDP